MEPYPTEGGQVNTRTPAEVDAYIDQLFACTDPVLQAAQQRADDAGLPQIQVSPSQGKTLYLFARMLGASRILELGALAGFSSIWLARALPAAGGRLVTLELEEAHAKVARANLADAGVDDRVELIVGPAIESLARLEKKMRGQPGRPKFDLIFMDADKASYPAYLEWCVRLSRSGTVILADNVVREGAVIDPDPEDESAVGASAFNTALAAHPRVEAVVMQQVGVKGHDGMAIGVVK